VWTKEQPDRYDSALTELADERVASSRSYGGEMGNDLVDLALERADEKLGSKRATSTRGRDTG
jgi:hypothetical protein